MQLFAPRPLFLLMFSACLAIVGGALYMEHVLGQEPCPLCIVQRIEVMAVGLVCLIAALHNPQGVGRKVYAGIAMLCAAAGVATAARQVYLTTLPADQVPACLPPLDYMLEAFPLWEILSKMLSGTADCAKVDWTFLGLSIPELSLLSFVGLSVAALLQLLRK
ncbi:disulfide bond formation protein B [Atopomonas sediminilitoris]|uniref:disulfide bond formation protein B n=1 Tax=Atopomonas sediminilitoris TaxID=2919919 RepID=UPI001F4EAD1D|nr:disulfide bond formation protein B [Atopomonas sediminilitoris]MCJ8169573.1 disulfide bond formation protein B [Atopomonas sediminilitoris]